MLQYNLIFHFKQLSTVVFFEQFYYLHLINLVKISNIVVFQQHNHHFVYGINYEIFIHIQYVLKCFYSLESISIFVIISISSFLKRLPRLAPFPLHTRSENGASLKTDFNYLAQMIISYREEDLRVC